MLRGSQHSYELTNSSPAALAAGEPLKSQLVPSLSDVAYTTLDNDVYALFPTNLTQGLTLVFGAHSVRMTPAGNGLTVTAGGNVTKTTTASLADSDITERLLYPNVFGPGTAVQYTPTLTGVKEEILLSHNVGQNSFDFLVETGGLILTETNGQFVLIDPETEQTVGTLGEIIVFDSAGQITRGNMTAQTVKEGEIYGVTISVDQGFLAGATYPVSIDPTATIINPTIEEIIGEPKAMIEDVSIYSDANAVNYTFIEWHQIGDVISTDYRGQAAFRFPLLYDPNGYYNYFVATSSDITSFVLHVKSTSNTTASNVLRASLYIADWPENNYGHVQKLFGSPYYGDTYISPLDMAISNVPSNATFSMDLTEYAKMWKDLQHGDASGYPGAPDTGVLLWNYENEGNIWLESVGYSSDIFVTMDYALFGAITGTVYVNSLDTHTFLAREDDNELKMKAGTLSEIGPQIAWDIVYRGQGKYTLHPAGNRSLYLNEEAMLVDDPEYNDCEWLIETSTAGGYIITNAGTEDVLMPEIDGTVIVASPTIVTVAERSWRVVDIETYAAREVQSISVEDFFAVKEQATQILVVPSSNNALWTSYEDFSYTLQNYSSTTDNITSASISNTGVLTANNYGVATITIVHKPTQVSTTAKVRVVKEYVLNQEVSYTFNREAIATYIDDYYRDYNADYFDFSVLFDVLGGDCTNFVSQCLHHGGIAFFNPPSSKAESGQKQQDPTSWYHIKDYCGLLNVDGVSYTWSGAENFRLFWKDRCYEYVVYSSPDQFEADLEYWTNILKTGDVIQLMKNGTTANHSMIVQSVADDTIYIAQHSADRIDHDIKDTLASSDITDTTCIVVMRIVND